VTASGDPVAKAVRPSPISILGLYGVTLSVSPSAQSIFPVIDCISKHELLEKAENFTFMAGGRTALGLTLGQREQRLPSPGCGHQPQG